MDNRISLAEYLSSYRTIYEKRKVFYAISKEMHRIHNDGQYITKLSYQSISVCFTNPSDIRFSESKKIGQVSIEEVIKIKLDNIKKLAHIMICSYLDSFDYRSSLLNLNVLKDSLEQIKNCYHLDDIKYFEGVLFQDEYLYYDDYIEDLEGTKGCQIVTKDSAFTNYFLLGINLVMVIVLGLAIFIFV